MEKRLGLETVSQLEKGNGTVCSSAKKGRRRRTAFGSQQCHPAAADDDDDDLNLEEESRPDFFLLGSELRRWVL
jgi:hypothetical protein